MEQLVLPSGYRFRPTDSELILYYLKNKILGKELPVNIIPTIDVFSCNPDQLPLSEFTHGMPNERYFFSNRRKGRILTEDGFYHVSSTGSIYDKNKLVGFVRTLDFYHGRPNKGIKSKWTVHEFRVNPQVFQEDEDAQENVNLICFLF
ncbi:NAC transcription factor 29 [Jatropha curcas]|uniref:NAC transcription factor 29 n=1 Tax=Jatropha curcas TaxID=180498 RepID=UPI001895753B|nr:NAC transcription factor 29 [Jatropha curcas]